MTRMGPGGGQQPQRRPWELGTDTRWVHGGGGADGPLQSTGDLGRSVPSATRVGTKSPGSPLDLRVLTSATCAQLWQGSDALPLGPVVTEVDSPLVT